MSEFEEWVEAHRWVVVLVALGVSAVLWWVIVEGALMLWDWAGSP